MNPPTMPVLSGPPRCVWDARATLGEGTCWSAETQSLWWVDILSKRLFEYRPADLRQRSWDFEEEISAVAERTEGPGLIVTLRRGFALFDPECDALAQYLHRPSEEPPGNRFNDGKCDAAGRFWGGTMDFACQAETGAIYRFGPGEECVRHPLGFAVTNGPAWSLDQRTMFINDTVRGRVFALDTEPASGTVANLREWLRLERGDGLPDGMTTDALGRLWIAHWGGGCVSCHDGVNGVELGRITLPASQITNCAFGGTDLRTLFVTSAREGLSSEQLLREPLAGGLFAVEVDEPGLPAHRFRG